MNEPTTLHGKRALITGASSGIGRAIAARLALAGCRVALLARREERLREIAGQMEHAVVCPADLSDEAGTASAIQSAAAEWDGLDILINAAGVARQAQLTDGNPDDWRDMMEINVLALARVTREVLPHFPEPGGHVINISSMSGHRVPGRGGFYAATKFAVRALTEGLRQELRHAGNLTRVGSISPGFVDTEMLDEYFQSTGNPDAKYQAITYPILQPEEVADLVFHQLTMPATAEVTDVLVRPTAQVT